MSTSSLPLSFTARIVSGAGRGKGLGVPTLNLDLRDVPESLPDGVFACRAMSGGKTYIASAHNGPRPTFDNSRSCEVHLIDATLPVAPETVEVEFVQFLRGVTKFDSPAALVKQMEEDIQKTRDLLA